MPNQKLDKVYAGAVFVSSGNPKFGEMTVAFKRYLEGEYDNDGAVDCPTTNSRAEVEQNNARRISTYKNKKFIRTTWVYQNPAACGVAANAATGTPAVPGLTPEAAALAKDPRLVTLSADYRAWVINEIGASAASCESNAGYEEPSTAPASPGWCSQRVM